MENLTKEQDLVFRDKGVVETPKGLIAGFWIRDRKGRREIHLFAKPIKRTRFFRVERKTITVDGQTIHDVPVKVYPLVNSLTHWGKYSG